MEETSISNKIKVIGVIIKQEESLKDLRAKLQQETVAYLEHERRIIIAEELNRLREKHFLQRTMEEFRAVDSRHNRRLR